MLRPHVKSEPVGLGVLAQEMERCKPQLVISSKPNTVAPGTVPAWVELSLDYSRPTKICAGGHYREHAAPLALETLLEIVDEVERLIQTQADFRRC